MTTTFRLATFNVESLDNHVTAPATLDTRIAVLRPQLERLEADILCLQEVNAQRSKPGAPRQLEALDKLLAGTPYADYERALSLGQSNKRPADHHNLVTLSRWPIRQWQSRRHVDVPPPLVRSATASPPARDAEAVEWDRPLLWTSIEPPGDRPIEVINLHLRAPLAAPIVGQKQGRLAWRTTAGWAEGFYLAALKRNGQALEARLLVDELLDRDSEAHVVVCGDFNTGQHESPTRILLAEAEDTGNPALTARALIALARGLPDSQRYSVLHAGRRALYDHILVSRSLYARFRGIAIHNETLVEEETVAPGSPESFHAPLVASFAGKV